MSRTFIACAVPIILNKVQLASKSDSFFVHPHFQKPRYPAFPPPLRSLTTTSTMSSNPVFRSGNLAVITGGASGIGLALAAKCASYGMSVLIADNNSANLSSAKSSIKGKVETVEVDVSKVSDFEKLKAKVEKDFGGTYLSIILFPSDISEVSGDEEMS